MKKTMVTAIVTFFCGGVAKMKKKTMTTFVTFFNSFVAKNGDGKYSCLFGGFIAKKVTVVMLSPSFKVVVL